jgi:hypothetical protein
MLFQRPLSSVHFCDLWMCAQEPVVPGFLVSDAPSSQHSALTRMVWSADGRRTLIGDVGGTIHILTVADEVCETSPRRFVRLPRTQRIPLSLPSREGMKRLSLSAFWRAKTLVYAPPSVIRQPTCKRRTVLWNPSLNASSTACISLTARLDRESSGILTECEQCAEWTERTRPCTDAAKCLYE